VRAESLYTAHRAGRLLFVAGEFGEGSGPGPVGLALSCA